MYGVQALLDYVAKTAEVQKVIQVVRHYCAKNSEG
jgi:hypothetical protein